jgi:hypothetical protein
MNYKIYNYSLHHKVDNEEKTYELLLPEICGYKLEEHALKILVVE